MVSGINSTFLFVATSIPLFDVLQFIDKPVDEHLGYVHSEDIKNKAARDI